VAGFVYDNARLAWREDGTDSWSVTGITATGTSNSYQVNTIWPTYAENTTGSMRYVYEVNGNVWVSDQYPAQTVTYDYGQYNHPVAQPAISQEEADRRLRETRERKHRQAIRRKRAVRKGQRLLVSMLSETQKWEYAKTGTFTVCGADGELYRLRKGGTVHQLGKNGTPEWSHCIHLSYSYIDEDSLIALKLLLETDPANFHRVANSMRLSPSSANRPNVLTAALASARQAQTQIEAMGRSFQRMTAAAEEARLAAERLSRAYAVPDMALAA